MRDCRAMNHGATMASSPRVSTRYGNRRRPHCRQDSMGVKLPVSIALSMCVAIMTLAVSSFVSSFMHDASVSPSAGADLVGIESTISITEGSVDGGTGDYLTLSSYGEPDISGWCPVVWVPQEDGSFVNSNGFVLDSGRMFGVDVSEWNGLVDWEVARSCGVDFAMIRCGVAYDDAYYDDGMWERNACECERLGIPYGVYLYSYATTVDGVYSEASHVIRLLDGHHPTMGVWYDVEEGRQAEVLDYDPVTFNMFMDIFADEVEDATGCETGIYASASWFSTHLAEIASRGRHPIWVACWADSEPEGIDHVCWQAGVAVIPGFNSQVDFNVLAM